MWERIRPPVVLEPGASRIWTSPPFLTRPCRLRSWLATLRRGAPTLEAGGGRWGVAGGVAVVIMACVEVVGIALSNLQKICGKWREWLRMSC